MAEGYSPTIKAYAACAGFFTTGSTAPIPDVPAYLCLDNTDMTTQTATTNAPSTELTVSLARALATRTNSTITVANDTCQVYYQWTSGSTATVYGAEAMSTTPAGNMLGWHRWAAGVPIVATDVINQYIKFQFVIGS